MKNSGSDKGAGESKAGKKEGGLGIERRVASMLNSAAGLSGKAFRRAANSGLLTDTLFKSPERLELMGRAGRALKDMRQTAGLSVEELSSIIDVKDPDILRAVEEGKTGLPVDVMLRLASYYSRNDPLPFIIRFSRTYHPWLSQFLNMTGLDRLMIKAERERKFLKIYRNVDNARKLSDEDFEQVLAFTRRAFNMALHFAEDQARVEPSRRRKGAKAGKAEAKAARAASTPQSDTSAADATPPGAREESALAEETLDQLETMVQSEFEATMAEPADSGGDPAPASADGDDAGPAQPAAPKPTPNKAAASSRRKASAKRPAAKARASKKN